MANDIKIFLLKRNEELPNYDYFKGFVIATTTAQKARRMARDRCKAYRTGHGKDWLDAKKTTLRCVALDSMCKAEGVLLGSFLNG